MTSNVEKDPKSSDWEIYFAKLEAFKKRNGHTKVPRHYSEDTKLAIWVAEKRKDFRLYAGKTDAEREALYAKSSIDLTPNEAKKLESIGFECSNKNPRHQRWDFRYQQLKDFVAKYGHTQVPIGWEENVKLANWISTQRQEYKNMMNGRSSQLNEQRIQLLNHIGFAWEVQRGGPRRQLKPASAKEAKSPEGAEKGVVPGKALGGGTVAAKKSSPKTSVAESPSQSDVRPPQLQQEESMPRNYLQNPALYQELILREKQRQNFLLEQQILAGTGIWQYMPAIDGHNFSHDAGPWNNPAALVPFASSFPATTIGGLDFPGDAFLVQRMLSMRGRRPGQAAGSTFGLPVAVARSHHAMGSNLFPHPENFESLPQPKRRKKDPPARLPKSGNRADTESQSKSTAATGNPKKSWLQESIPRPNGTSLTNGTGDVVPKGIGSILKSTAPLTGTKDRATAASPLAKAALTYSLGKSRSSLQNMNGSFFDDAENDNSF